MAELKPCPFCGSKATIKVNDGTLNCVAVCGRCQVTMKRNFKGHRRLHELLVELITHEWNRRVDNE